MFITFEGIDGCGKTTQAALLAKLLEEKYEGKRRVLWTREPGGWTGGSWIRERILEGDLFHPMSELFLFLVDRCEHVRREILPVLDDDGVVICERYTDSTLAYQSWGRGIPSGKIETLFEWCSFPRPDRTFWLDITVKKAMERVCLRGGRDRFEAAGYTFLERVRTGFSSLAQREPLRINTIEASEEPQVLASTIFSLVEVSSSR